MIHNILTHWTAEQSKGFDEYRTTEAVYARIPTETNCPTCGWDVLSQSAINMGCATCHGIGKITTWVAYAVNCRLMWTSTLKFAYPFPASGVELGDCVITVPQEFVAVMDLVMNNERAYVVANDKTVRPTSLHVQNVQGIVTEYEYVCNIFSPE